jgi:TP901 family phage tail tape measure protein
MSDFAHSGIQIDIIGDALAELKAIRGEFDVLKKSVNNIETDTGKANTSLKSLNIIKFDTIANSLNGLGGIFGDVGNKGMQFEDQVAELSAITGIVGKDLDQLKESARTTGKETGLGAAAAAETYKLLASNIDIATIGGIDGLKNLQEQTILLSQASGLQMPRAADVMTAAINQFGLKGTEASRVTNVLAAASKYGAAEVDNLGETLKYVGPVAGAAKLSIESTAGAIEVLSQSNIKGSMAGTAMTGILVAMQSKLGVDFSKKGLPQVLEELKPKLNDVTYLTKTFGEGQLAAVQVLIKNAAGVKEMTEKVSEQGVAQAQAEINTATYSTTLKKLKATFDDVKISIYENTGALMPLSEMFIGALGTISSIVPALSLAKSAWALMTPQTVASAVAMDGAAVSSTAAATGIGAMGATIVAVTGLIAILAVGIGIVITKYNELQEIKAKAMGEKINQPLEAEKGYIESQAEARLKRLPEKYKDITTARKMVAEEERKSIINEIEELKKSTDPAASEKRKALYFKMSALNEYIEPKASDAQTLINKGAKSAPLNFDTDKKSSSGSSTGAKSITNHIQNLVGVVNVYVNKVDDGVKAIGSTVNKTLLAELNDMEAAL